MPELPEVEMVARTLRPRLVGRKMLRIETSGLALRREIDLPQLRAACLQARVRSVERQGKYLLVDLSSERVLLVHLGMSGRLLFAAPADPRAPHTHAVFHLDRQLELRYVDPRRFGVIAVYPRDRLRGSPELAGLGLDPFDPGFTPSWLSAALGAGRRELKGFLLDQTRIAGLGNIYVCEALFLAGLGPRRRTHLLSPARIERLHGAIRTALQTGLDNRGTSFSDYVDAEGSAGGNQAALLVYAREGQPCRRCAATIRRLVQGARSTFYCPRCQR